MRHATTALIAIVTGFAPPLPAQVNTRTFLLRSGVDTVSIEQVTRGPGRIEGELVFRGANQRWHYVVMTGPDERVLSVDNEFRYATDESSAAARQTAHIAFVGDSVIVHISQSTMPDQRLASRFGAVPYVNPSFAMVELALRRAAALGRDSVTVPLFVMIGGATIAAEVIRRGPDSTIFVGGGAPSHLAIGRDGLIRGGGVPSQHLVLEVTSGSRPGALAGPKLDYSAPPDAPYTAESVRVATPMGHSLAGTLTLPKGATRPVPAIVTITGSGPEDRDEAIPPVKGYRPFREIADALGRNGIAVLRMDDRGFGESGGNAANATSEDFAADVRAGLAYLRARPEIDGRRLGLVGHSEGGLIAPMLAASDTSLKGIVLMAGTAYTGRKILQFQNRYAIDRMPGLSAAGRDSAMAVALKGLDSAVTRQPWIRFFMDYDPVTTARKVRTPVLILQGATDQQVTADQAPLLDSAFRAGGNRDVTTRLFPETNHLFLADPDGNPANYPKLTVVTMRPEVMRAIVEWLTRHLQ